MAKKDQPASPAPPATVAPACPPEKPAEQASAICATNIGCETQVPYCPGKEPNLKPHTIGHTGWHTCIAHTQERPGCTTVTSPPADAAAQTIGTWFHGCGIPPVTLTCAQNAVAAPQTIGYTGWYTCHYQGTTAATVCTQVQCAPPTHLLGCTTVTANPQTNIAICGTGPQAAAAVGLTGWYTCHQGTAATVCTQVQCAPPTHLLGCTTVTTPPATLDCPQQAAGTIGVTGWYTCHQGTAATVCTQVQCAPPTHLLGCTTVTTPPATLDCPQRAAVGTIGVTGWYTCHQGTAATVCTQVQCTPQTHLLGCTTVTANPQTNIAICGTGPQAAAAVGVTGWYTCHQGTAATVCTQVQCTPPTHLLGCTTVTTPPATLDCPQQAAVGTIGVTGWYTCHQGTAATVCTQVQCAPPTHLLGCTTVTANPHTNPAICGTGPQAAAAVGTIGVTGWYTCHQGTAATVCTRYGCNEAMAVPSPTTTVAPTHLLGCTTVTTPPTNVAICGTGPQAAAAVGPTGWYTCGHTPTCGNDTKIVATTYTQPFTHCACPQAAAAVGPTGWYTCGQ